MKLEIYDRVGGLMYASKNTMKMRTASSDFAFVHVESLKPQNGVRAKFLVTVTLGVDTP